MATLITDQITSSTASRPRRTMPISAALGQIHGSELIFDSSAATTTVACAEVLGSPKSCAVDSTKGALGMYAAQGAFRNNTRLGTRPPGPPV